MPLDEGRQLGKRLGDLIMQAAARLAIPTVGDVNLASDGKGVVPVAAFVVIADFGLDESAFAVAGDWLRAIGANLVLCECCRIHGEELSAHLRGFGGKG